MSKGPDDILNLNKDDIDKNIKAFEKRERQREIDDMKEFLSLPVGKRIARRILDKAQTFVDAEGVDVYATYINIGKQKLGHWFLLEMDIAKPNAYQDMVREHKSAMVIKEQILNNIKAGNKQEV